MAFKGSEKDCRRFDGCCRVRALNAHVALPTTMFRMRYMKMLILYTLEDISSSKMMTATVLSCVDLHLCAAIGYAAE